jgi:L-ascorbate metabolism protein UlaG (beta-lactamase superfamily)
MTMLRRAKKVGRKFQNPVPTTVGGFSTIFKLLPQLLFAREERVPQTPLGPFRTDASVYATAPESGLRVTWMGHSSMLLEIDGMRVLIDPVWDERASPRQWFGPKRFFAAPLPLEELPKLDVVLVSHDHYDHLGEGTVRRLAASAAAEAQWVTPLEVAHILQEFGVRPGQIAELDWMDQASVDGDAGALLQITALPSRHFSGRSLSNRFETLWGSFVLRGMRPGGHSVYFGADSGWWPGFGEIGAAYGPFDLTMLEIGAYNALWHQIHMGPDGAAQAFAELDGAGLLMPIHWGLFDLALHSWRWPIQRLLELAEMDALKLWAPEPGCPTEVVPGVEVRSDWWR